MSYKLKGLPSTKATVVELADFLEVECIKSAAHSYNLGSAGRALGILSDVMEGDFDPLYFNEDDHDNERLVFASQEIERRINACGGNYPFILENEGNTLVLNNEINRTTLYSYLFLLFLTRLKMTGSDGCARFGQINGPLLFEEFSHEVLKNFLGHRTNGLVFGSSVNMPFNHKVQGLINNLGEGDLFKSKDFDPTNAVDSKLDGVVWKGFRDNRGSQLICFAQCKTGTSWHEYVNQLQPDEFIKKWFSDSPILNPVNTFIIADILKEHYYERSVGKLFFDRCRLMDFLPPTIDSIFDRMFEWTSGAIEYIEGTPVD